MATYESTRLEVSDNLQSSVGGFLAQQILQALDEAAGGQSETVDVQTDWRPGDVVAPGTDVLVVAPGSVSGNVTVPAGVSTLIFTGPTGVNAHFLVSQDTTMSLTESADEVSYEFAAGATVEKIVADLRGGDDVFIGAENAMNFVAGGEGDDTMTGGSRGDIFFADRGSDTVDGRGGYDQAILSGSVGDYNESFVDGVLTLTNKSTGEVTSLKSIEYVSFESGGVIVNVDNQQGFAAASLFEAILGRVPDKAGMEFYTNSGATPEAIANGMLHSAEFTADHGNVDALSNEAFINILYDTAFDRAPDAEGLSYWLDKLSGADGSAPLSKAQVALQFGYSNEAQSKFDGLINFDQDDQTT